MSAAAGEARDGGRGESAGDRPGDLLSEALDRMAHQIKNPLQAVAMNLEVVRTRIRSEAPGLWADVERYGEAVDENVALLDRRLRLLLRLGRRSPGARRESVDVAALIRDFAEALQLDEARPAIRVTAEGTQLAARVRPGYVLELTLDLWRTVRGTADGAGELPLSVRAAAGEVTVEARLTAGTSGARRDARDRWEATAEQAGGRLDAREEDGEAVLRLVLPAD